MSADTEPGAGAESAEPSGASGDTAAAEEPEADAKLEGTSASSPEDAALPSAPKCALRCLAHCTLPCAACTLAFDAAVSPPCGPCGLKRVARWPPRLAAVGWWSNGAI
jgi:hypothetical protein